jgi:hypothetical protein
MYPSMSSNATGRKQARVAIDGQAHPTLLKNLANGHLGNIIFFTKQQDMHIVTW